MANFSINDRRHSGIITGETVASAKRQVGMSADAMSALAAGRQGPIPTDTARANQMRRSRTDHMSKVGSYIGGESLSIATGRPRDPFFYWQQNNLPYDFTNAGELMALRTLCRHIYKSHSLMASAIDIYSYWPMTDMEFSCKDKELEEFHTDLFMDQLNYEEFLPSMLHDYWVTGEAFPFGSFNETLGVWESEELLNPDDVYVDKSPFVAEDSLYIRLPQSLRRILTTGQPPEQYWALMRSYPELQAYTSENAKMPVSNVLLKHLKFKGDNYSARGLPIMYRALRPLMQEEMLNAAQDAIADRLYTPLILAKIGASATDLGTDQPWVPTPQQISDFEGSLDAALAADFRVLTTHFAVDMSSVFGRETMPNLDPDFDRLAEKQLQSFGISKTMLNGAQGGETYAADAMNRDLISQLLGRAQRMVRKHVKDRMLVVAEAQGHYDYEVRGGKRYPIMEEILEVDEETGEQRIVEQPKLLVPDLKLANMNIKDEETQRAFLEQLRSSGVPISMQTRMTNIDIDLKKEVEQTADEQVDQSIEAQEVRRKTYLGLKQRRLPIPQDLLDDFEPKVLNADDGEGTDSASTTPTRVPSLGTDTQDSSALAPTDQELAVPPGIPLGLPAGPGGTLPPESVGAPRGGLPGGAGQPKKPTTETGATVPPKPRNLMRPPESDEMRAQMPKASARTAHLDTTLDYRKIAEHLPEPPILVDAVTQEQINYDSVYDADGNPVPRRAKAGGIVQGPRHLGMRRHAGITADTVIGYEPQDESEEDSEDES